MAALPIAVGEVIAGKYRVERLIGSGGMGMVVAAWHVQLDQLVAVKLLHAETASSDGATERFRREARAAARIRSEHVARVIDVGILPGGIPYIVMEYLEGNDLSEELARRGPLPAEECAEYVMQAIEALAEAHAVGIVHRDLKPGNLFLATRADGTRLIKVLDFGISKQVSTPGEAALTRTASLIGSPLYMSPEQMRSARSVDARADIWSLGAILYELLTGRPPFGGETVIEACTAILNDELPRMSTFRSDVPPHIEAIVRRCLQKDKGERYPSVGDLATELAGFAPASRLHAERALRVLGSSAAQRLSNPGPGQGDLLASSPVLGSSPIIVPSPVASASPVGASTPLGRPPQTAASWEATGSSFRPRRWPLLVMVLAVLAVVGAVGYRQLSPARPSASAAPGPTAAVAPKPPVATRDDVPKPTEPVAGHPELFPVVSVGPSISPSASVAPRVAPRPGVHPQPPKPRPTSDSISDFGGRR